MIDFCRKSMENKNRGKRGIGMKKIKKRKRYRLKRPAVVVSGVICAVCAVAFAGKAVSGVAEQKKQAQSVKISQFMRKNWNRFCGSSFKKKIWKA